MEMYLEVDNYQIQIITASLLSNKFLFFYINFYLNLLRVSSVLSTDAHDITDIAT